MQRWCKERERGCGPEKKSEELGTFFRMVNLRQSSWTSAGAPLDASERGTSSQYLAPRMLVKTRYQNIFFFFIHILFINNTSFTFVCVFVCVSFV